MIMRVATEKSWKEKCSQIGIPYFEKSSSHKVVSRIQLKPNSIAKLVKESALRSPKKSLVSQPSESIRKRLLNINFQEVN